MTPSAASTIALRLLSRPKPANAAQMKQARLPIATTAGRLVSNHPRLQEPNTPAHRDGTFRRLNAARLTGLMCGATAVAALDTAEAPASAPAVASPLNPSTTVRNWLAL